MGSATAHRDREEYIDTQSENPQLSLEISGSPYMYALYQSHPALGDIISRYGANFKSIRYTPTLPKGWSQSDIEESTHSSLPAALPAGGVESLAIPDDITRSTYYLATASAAPIRTLSYLGRLQATIFSGGEHIEQQSILRRGIICETNQSTLEHSLSVLPIIKQSKPQYTLTYTATNEYGQERAEMSFTGHITVTDIERRLTQWGIEPAGSALSEYYADDVATALIRDCEPARIALRDHQSTTALTDAQDDDSQTPDVTHTDPNPYND